MATAPASAPADGQAGGGKKKVIIIAVVVVLALVALLAGAFVLMQKNVASASGDAYELSEEGAAPKAKLKPERNTPPIFVPLEPFIVNLADQSNERFAQIGINLQVDSSKVADEMKVYMPAIRNEILLLLSRKTADELMTAEGKMRLANEIRRGSARAMGYEISEPDPEVASQPENGQKRITRIRVEEYNPILNVHYANFIIQ